MKRHFIPLLGLLLLLSACSGASSSDCGLYCEKMSEVKALTPDGAQSDPKGCYGDWICVNEYRYDANGLCLKREIAYGTLVLHQDGAPDVVRQNAPLCFRNWKEAPKEIQDLFFNESTNTWNELRCISDFGTYTMVSCKAAGTVDGDGEDGEPIEAGKPILVSWSRIFNPADAGSCESQCKANTKGGSMPDWMKAALDGVSTDCYDFLQVELDQQCRSEASEQ